MQLLGHYLNTPSRFRQTICLCRHVFILLLKPSDIAPAHNAPAYTHVYAFKRNVAIQNHTCVAVFYVRSFKGHLYSHSVYS